MASAQTVRSGKPVLAAFQVPPASVLWNLAGEGPGVERAGGARVDNEHVDVRVGQAGVGGAPGAARVGALEHAVAVAVDGTGPGVERAGRLGIDGERDNSAASQADRPPTAG